ncbi:MAG: SDR family oxidoreductase [Acidimicrobiales bacterium]|nr:SDR family oxidoreductase [Acidimicrobiales bacterium]
MSADLSLRSIADRVAIVTGAASGMGEATAELLAAEGARVAVMDIDAGGVERVVAEIEDDGGTAAGIVVDLADPVAITAAVQQVRAALGPIDIVVNNAGIPVGVTFDDPSYDDAWERSIAVNLTSQQRMVRACLPDLVRNGDGRVVNIASTEGILATPRTSPYTVAKHGVIGLTRSLAVELGHTGVTFNCICPGPIRTGMTAGIPEERKQAYAKRRVPARRYAEPEEVAHMTLSLVLPAASFVNGAVIPVDGGVHIKAN